MLGGLARWLRFVGLDTTFPQTGCGVDLIAAAREEGRWLLTRNRRLAARAGPRVLCVQAIGVEEQLREVLGRLRLSPDPARFFSRCSRCNGRLAALPREAALRLVPPFVAAHAPVFVQCSGCARVYWPGSHQARIEARLAALSPR